MSSNLTRRRFLVSALGLMGAAVPLLAACSSTPAAPTSAPTQAPSSTPPTKPAAGQTPAAQAASSGEAVTLVDHMWVDPNPVWNKIYTQFATENPNIKVNRQWFPRSDLHTKEMALAATGQIGDKIMINLAPLVSEMQAKGVAHSLDAYINGDKEFAWDQFWPGNKKTYTIKGQVWGLPQVGHPGYIIQLMNLDLYKKYGATPPDLNGKWSVEDLVSNAAKLTRDGNYGLAYIPSVEEWLVGYLRMWGGDLYNAEGTKCLLAEKESVQAVQWLQDLWWKHKVAMPYQPGPQGGQAVQDAFLGGKAGLYMGTSVWINIMKTQHNDKFKWDATVSPLGPSGKHGTQVSSAGYTMWAKTKHPDQTWTLLKFLTGKWTGLTQVLSGSVSPGSRFDVWNSPELQAMHPAWKRVADAVVNPPAPEMAPWYYPANGRFFETSSTATNILDNVWLNKMSPEEGCKKAAAEVQKILDKPMV